MEKVKVKDGGKKDVRGRRRGQQRGGVGGRGMERTEGRLSRRERRNKYTYTTCS